MTSVRVPQVGDMVHYTSYGTPGGEYASVCRAATVTEVVHPGQQARLKLAVINPTGLFFDDDCPADSSPSCGTWMDPEMHGGTWHWFPTAAYAAAGR